MAAPSLRICASVAEALASVTSKSDDIALLVDGDAGGCSVRVASMTAFGPSLWESPRHGVSVAASVLTDTLRRAGVHLYAPDSSCLRPLRAAAGACLREVVETGARPADKTGESSSAAVAAFLGRRPEPAATSVTKDGDRSRSWAVAVMGADPDEVKCGDEMILVAAAQRNGVALRWRGANGQDGGLHAVVARELEPGERRLVECVRGRVISFSFGLAPAARGLQTRVRTVVLDVPMALVRAFRDGKLPRHWIAEQETSP